MMYSGKLRGVDISKPTVRNVEGNSSDRKSNT